MCLVRHRPGSPLDKLVECFWWSDRTVPMGPELMLPTGTASLVFSFADRNLTCWSPHHCEPIRWSRSIVHGPQTGPYTSGPKQPGMAVGVAFRPGATGAVLGVPGAELADQHVPLEDIWGRRADTLRERLWAGPHEAFAVLEQELTARLKRPLLMHPAVADSLARHPRTRMSDLEHGYSNRHFIALFRTAIGMTPGQHFRIQRFSSALRKLATDRSCRLAELAASTGYADQSHLNREFRQLSGTSPSRYRPRDADSPHHHSLKEDTR